jgi:hypothetical protein
MIELVLKGLKVHIEETEGLREREEEERIFAMFSS